MVAAKPSASRVSWSLLLLLEALLAALLFDGAERYLLTLSWFALSLWLVYHLSLRQKIEIFVDSTIAAIFLFSTWMLLSLLWHPAVFYGVATNWLLWLFPFVLLVTAYVVRERDLSVSLYLILALGLIIGILSLYQSLALGEQAKGLFYNKNNNAAYLNLTLLPVMSLILFLEGRKYWYWLAAVAFVVLFFAVLQTTSRAGLLAFVICALAVMLFALKKGKVKEIFLVLMLGLLVVILHVSISTAKVSTDMASAVVRKYIFGSTVEMIRDAGPLGAGNGMWRHYYPEYRDIHDSSAGYYVHNDYLQIIYELGLPGFAFLFLFVLQFSYRCFLLIRQESDMNNLAIYVGLFAAITAVAMHSMLTFNFYVAGIIVVMGFYTGLLLRRASNRKLLNGYYFTVALKGRSVLAVFVLMMILGKSIILPGYADAMSRGLLGVKLSQLEPEDRYHAFMRLRLFDPEDAFYAEAAANSLAESGTGKSHAERKEILRQSRALLHEATRNNRFVKGIYVSEAKLLKSYSDVVGPTWRDQAIALAEKDLSLDPAEVSTRLFLAHLVAGTGNKEKAIEILLIRLDHISNMHMPYYQYGRALAAELGKSDIAKRFAERIEHFHHAYPRVVAQP